MWKWSFVVFAGVLAYMVGSLLSVAAATLLVGVGAGMLAAIPVIILLTTILASPRMVARTEPTYPPPWRDAGEDYHVWREEPKRLNDSQKLLTWDKGDRL